MSMFFIHADLRAADPAFVPHDKPPSGKMSSLSSAMLAEIREISEGAALVIPAYNYDFPTSGRFDPLVDSPQVGKFSEFLMTLGEFQRTTTPVFSHFHDGSLSELDLRPFSEQSAFGVLVQREGYLLLFGTRLRSLTFLHHIEHVAEIPYRYEKTFRGRVVRKDEFVDVSVTFHVRPKNFSISYDREKLQSFLTQHNLIRQVREGVWAVPAKEFMELCLSELEKDNLWLLGADSRDWVSRKLDTLGRPFTLGDFEPDSTASLPGARLTPAK